MTFRNASHKAVFNSVADKLDRTDKTQMAVLYLLTADVNLWKAAKQHIENGKIHLYRVKLGRSGEKEYSLLCCAKDIAYGTEYINANDLANDGIIIPQVYSIIKKALDIRRNGLNEK